MSDTNNFVPVLEESHSNEKCREVHDILARIGDKWTVMVVGALSHGPVRYNQIRRSVEGISQRMLTLTLKGLEQDGLVIRTMYPTIPPRVDYELTDLGEKLIVPLEALYGWAIEHRPTILAAREEFAKKEQRGASTRACVRPM
ncbi:MULTISPECIES: helix-turn-helix domain-containing protein [Paraburkholderia]|uniref:Helix-turn-helix domain-containing protein n=1 Tax=Paraburkholderia madseniana TaxID=2599607 RepID=A0AAP5BHP9_9BURK|nr:MULTISPECIES: helix-turn-helix domain-containing protein [Paraburkholderia]MCX4149950.1 helix-turn-helix domain-containing protein [Paraburkholderia madseniana]MDN7152886.1 helix-turn-helix transcriptional regulator [Paraburkholderia sp. WS6]MDQ6411768.1 helix-turn-helix transcriptional regulator [Paraburkholderia madseniana]